MTTILILVVVTALLFDFANGWNDSANAIATAVSTRVLSPLAAVVFAASLNFLGALVSTEVAKTIGGGLVDSNLVSPQVILASMLAASLWVILCTLWGLPISGSHSLIGGLIGSAVAVFGVQVLKMHGIIKVLVALVVSPVLGLLVGYFLIIGLYWLSSLLRPRTVQNIFGNLQISSCGFMAFSHGMNDAQKVMGVITLALLSAKMIPNNVVPLWVILACAMVMALGTATGGWRVIRTLGMNLARIRPIEGFAAETSAGVVLSVAACMGVPVSTTHTITGSIIGVGAARNIKSVKWGIGAKIVYAWVFTLPVTALLGGAMALVIHHLG